MVCNFKPIWVHFSKKQCASKVGSGVNQIVMHGFVCFCQIEGDENTSKYFICILKNVPILQENH